MFVEFEYKIYVIEEVGELLMLIRMNEEYVKLNKLYFGDFVEIDEDISKEWLWILYFYMNYYVY